MLRCYHHSTEKGYQSGTLRLFIDEDEPILPTHEVMVQELAELPIVVVGGHDNWHANMK